MEKTEQLRPAGPGVGLDAGRPLEDAQAADELRRVDMSRDESLEPERPIEGGLDDPPIAAVELNAGATAKWRTFRCARSKPK